MTGLAKAVLVSLGRLEQSPAGSQDRRGREHWAEGAAPRQRPSRKQGRGEGDRALPSNPEGKSHLD